MEDTHRVYRIAAWSFCLWFWDLIVNLDDHLAAFVAQHGPWVYALLFAIVFCETGLVVTPFLPGDSLLFVAGAVAAVGGMDIYLVMATLITAALCGDNVNYCVGRWAGTKVFVRFVNPAHLQRTPRISTSAMAARRSSSRASCRSCAPTCRSSPGSARCRIRATSRTASRAR